MKGKKALECLKGMQSNFEDLKFFVTINFSENDMVTYEDQDKMDEYGSFNQA